MSDENIGLFRAIWRFITFWKLRRTLGLVRAADQQFTGSVGGISDAYDIAHDKMVREYTGLESAVGEVQMVVEGYKQELLQLDEKEKTLVARREGALAKYEEEGAKTAPDAALTAKHKAAFDAFDAEIQKIDARQKELEQFIAEKQQVLEGYYLQLTKMQREIRELPVEKAQTIADYVSSEKIIELNHRIAGIQTSLDRGPIDAVRTHVRKKVAQANVSQKIAGADSALQDQEYEIAGRSSVSGDRMQAMLAARKAEREAKTGVKQVVTEKAEGEGNTRPVI